MEFEELKCPLCHRFYDDTDVIPRMLPNCGHTFCTECLQHRITTEEGEVIICPEDQESCPKPGSATEFPKNFALIRLAKKHIKKTENAGAPEREGGSEESSQDKNMCPIHDRKLEVVCVDDQQRICTNCALFGDHKSHDIRAEEDVLKEITLRAECLYEMYQVIEQNQEFFKATPHVEDMYSKFESKKGKLKADLDQKFKELRQVIDNKEKEIHDEVGTAFAEIEDNFKIIRDLPKFINDQVEDWKSGANSKLAAFEQKASKDRIAFEMLEERGQEEDIIQSGERILIEQEKNKELPISEIEGILDELSIHFDKSVLTKLGNFCQLSLGPNESALNLSTSKFNEELRMLELDRKSSIISRKDTRLSYRGGEDGPFLTGADSDDLITDLIQDATLRSPARNGVLETEESVTEGTEHDRSHTIEQILATLEEKSIEKIDFSGIDLTGEPLVAVMRILPESKSVTSLNFSRSNLTDSDAQVLFDCLAANDKVVELYLDDNKITDNCCSGIISMLGTNTTLKSLYMRQNPFENPESVYNKLKQFEVMGVSVYL
eukprot:CAMPEP_0115046582 /NCGR_PEP_ID=MMETSP0216-20121206/48824_1 /TAXON_ID=223996 /ORGANISM="Protocruzia adherens, Strain Boccale" /LENGTH=548 /DNA_ID=CAMNT_0002429669 /DNA_START=60 /DNA_END=1706 /DNA_ORIENTATION=+